MSPRKVVPAAGGVVWRKPSSRADGVEVLLIHRPRYDDWTFPKGKAEAGELPPVTAAREILEETGFRVRLGRPLPKVSYRIAGGVKEVDYWMAKTRGTSDFQPTKEVDSFRWCTLRAARKRLSYEHDIALLDHVEDLIGPRQHATSSLVLLRHAKAEQRKHFDGPDDRDRPLVAPGLTAAQRLVPVLDAFGPKRLFCSPALRCLQTLDPYAEATGRSVIADDRLLEGTSPKAARDAVRDALAHKRALLCSHRPVLPDLFAALDLEDPGLATGEAAVLHHRKGAVLAVERWRC
ncbi:NUDIX hydrolase [Aeromicrobium piscarium]|uniref:NUDIX hydrolase n=1 Tax=Aeromicrobium piscarium TaxID=2590901 RepID=A0A554SPK7_9ACTN|nr:NUDIX domain-containing protein [Aeromicrobium piscarium]TSD68209.1 NUDIX hydrolase [Aeromicrobium piscarium]